MNNKGFTLLEIMVSMAILAVSLVAVLRFQGQTLIVSGRAERITIATMLARLKVVETQIELEKGMKKNEFPDEKEETGEFDNPYELYKWNAAILWQKQLPHHENCRLFYSTTQRRRMHRKNLLTIKEG